MPAGPHVLFCCDPLTPGRFDEHYTAEVAIVRDCDGTVAAIDHDALARGDVGSAVRRVPRDSGPWWYRGWMIPTAHYRHLAQELDKRGAPLRISPRRYRSAHELPGWYATFRDVTPDSDWTPWSPREVPTIQTLQALASTLGPGPAIVKDFVKSRKHEWDQACYIPDLTDTENAAAVVARMVALQEGDLNGGIVLRRFENYRQRDGRAVEARVWWVDGVPTMITAHPDTPSHTPQPDLTAIAPLVVALGCPFVTTDLAQSLDGQWRVVEVGDGQVSDLPAGVDPTPLFARLAEPSTIDAPPRCPHCEAAGRPILFGLPTQAAHQAAERGELALRGCLMPDNAPQWMCPDGHEWNTSEAHWGAAIDAVVSDHEPDGPASRTCWATGSPLLP